MPNSEFRLKARAFLRLLFKLLENLKALVYYNLLAASNRKMKVLMPFRGAKRRESRFSGWLRLRIEDEQLNQGFLL